MDNIRLIFQGYCEGCKVSEPEIETHILFGDSQIQERRHIVKCKHAEACYEMRKKMLKEADESAAMEINKGVGHAYWEAK